METTLTCNHEIRGTANLQSDPREEFRAIDEYVRAYDKQWVTVAQMCLRVKQAELWKLGGYSSWEGWITKAAPKSARTIFWHVGLLRDLEMDFSAEELAQMPPETAKVMRKLSRATRSDPRVRRASNGKRKAFLETVKTFHPEEHIEGEYEVLLHPEESVFQMWREVIDGMRIVEEEPALSHEQCFEMMLHLVLQGLRPEVEKRCR